MRRGTTPTNIFTTDIDLSEAKVYITYKQGRDIILEKTNGDILFDAVEPENEDDEPQNEIKVPLSQEDTLQFKANSDVRVQIRAIFANGESVASNIVAFKTEEILKDGLIEYSED